MTAPASVHVLHADAVRIGCADLVVVGGVGRDVHPRIAVACACPAAAELRQLLAELRAALAELRR